MQLTINELGGGYNRQIAISLTRFIIRCPLQVRIRSGCKIFVLLTLLLWLMTSWAGVHGHFCFDGQEPPISLHVDVMGGHEVHTADESHQDIDAEVSQSVLAKLLKFDPPLPILLAAIFILLAITRTPLFFFYTDAPTPHRHAGIRPPLRAPPATPF
jgi:hypothetical protein